MDLRDITEAERQELYGRLYAFAHYLHNAYSWFRRTEDDTSVAGKTPHDYVVEAVTRYLEEPDKYDPTKRTFLSYLKLHIIRSMIRDDAESEENTTTADRASKQLSRSFHTLAAEEGATGSWRELIPAADQLFDEEMDYQTIIQAIKDELAPDPDALTIFEGICKGAERAEVIQEQGWTGPKYTNAWKRMDRVRRRVAAKFNIKEPK